MLEAGVPIKGRIGLDHPVIDLPARSGSVDLDDAQAGIERFEQRLVAGFDVALAAVTKADRGAASTRSGS